MRIAVALLGAVVLGGCGSRVPLGQVSGVVRAGGKPLSGVLVTFLPQGTGPEASLASMGTTDEQGHYELRTQERKAGAVVGQHLVIVEDLAIHSAPRSDDGTVLVHPPQRFGQDYADPLKSPLQREVKPGTQTIDVDLTQP